jgi:hypothetical protein
MPAAADIDPADALDRYGPLCRGTGRNRGAVHIASVVERGDCHRSMPPADMLTVTHEGEIPLRTAVCDECLAEVEDR